MASAEALLDCLARRAVARPLFDCFARQDFVEAAHQLPLHKLDYFLLMIYSIASAETAVRSPRSTSFC